MRAMKAWTVRRYWSVAGLGLLGVLLAPQVDADIAGPVFSIEARVYGESYADTFSVDYDDACWDPVTQTYAWSLPAPVDLVDGTTLVGKLLGAELEIHLSPAPQIYLEVFVESGDGYTEFYADSALVDFPTIPVGNAEGYFSAFARLWDGGDADCNLWPLPLPNDTGACNSYYNGAKPGGALFRELIGGFGATGGYGQSSQNHEGPFGADVYDMRVSDEFILTPNDQASAETTFGIDIVPEPAGIVLLALGGAFLGAWRRRS